MSPATSECRTSWPFTDNDVFADVLGVITNAPNALAAHIRLTERSTSWGCLHGFNRLTHDLIVSAIDIFIVFKTQSTFDIKTREGI